MARTFKLISRDDFVSKIQKAIDKLSEDDNDAKESIEDKEEDRLELEQDRIITDIKARILLKP